MVRSSADGSRTWPTTNYAVALVVLSASLVAGCTTAGGGQEYVEARAVEDVPDDAAVTSYDHESIADVDPIQEVIEEAATSDGSSASIEVTSAEAKRAREALGSVPDYDGDPGGFYVRKGNRTYVITFAKQQ